MAPRASHEEWPVGAAADRRMCITTRENLTQFPHPSNARWEVWPWAADPGTVPRHGHTCAHAEEDEVVLPVTPSEMASPSWPGYSNTHFAFVSCSLGRISRHIASYLSHFSSRAINHGESPCNFSPIAPYSWRLLGCCCCCYSYSSKWGTCDVRLGRDFSNCSAKRSQIGRNCSFLQYLALYRPSAVPHFTSSFLASPFWELYPTSSS